jgi:hypothetical protein
LGAAQDEELSASPASLSLRAKPSSPLLVCLSAVSRVCITSMRSCNPQPCTISIFPPRLQGLACPSSTETRCRRAYGALPLWSRVAPFYLLSAAAPGDVRPPGGREGDGSALETCPRARRRCSSPRRGQGNVSQPPRCLEDAGNGERETAGSRLRITSLDH